MSIKCLDVTFRYGSRHPLFEGLSLTTNSSPLVILGPNGAGKSTLMSMLAGRLKPQKGRVEVVGQQSYRAIRRVAGWMPQDIEPVVGLNLREQVAYVGWLRGMRQSLAWDSALEALDQVQLADVWRTSASKLSGGQRRRLGIAQTIVHKPSLILFDEPYAGLDPEQRAVVREVLRQLASTTELVVSTHQTEDIEEVYQEVLVMISGQVVWQGSVTSFFAEVDQSVPQVARAEVAYRGIVARARHSTDL